MINGILTGTITSSQSGPESNSNEGALHTSQIYRSEASSLDAVKCYTQDTLFFWGGGSCPSAEDTVSVF